MTQVAAAPEQTPEMARKRKNTVIWVVALCAIGLIFDGYDLVVYGAVLPEFMADPSLIGPVDKATGGLLGSYALFGVLVGALVAGSLGDIFGRRVLMLVSYAWFSLGMLVTSLMSTTTSFGIMRFITGLGVGSLVATTGAIVSEYAPPGKKNLCNAIVYSGVPMGSLLSALIAMLLLPIIGWKGMFMIGAIPFVTLLPIAIFKLPESVAWLASRGKLEQAAKVSEKTGVPIPKTDAAVAKVADEKSTDSRAGWSGLFTVYLLPTIILGLVSATGLLLVYSLNTWLPALMKPVMGAQASLALLLVLNGGAVLGALFGSRFADKFGPQRVVALCFLIGAISIGIVGLIAAGLTSGVTPAAGIIALLLAVLAIVGLGTSGTQTLIYGLVANYYRTNVRGAGVAWCAGFGRLGGVGGPILGGALAAAFGANLHMIFYVLAAIALVGMILTISVPKPKPLEVEREGIVDDLAADVPGATEETDATAGVAGAGAAAGVAGAGATAAGATAGAAQGGSIYGTIMVVVDETGNELTRSRVTEFVRLTGKSAHLVYLAPEHIVAGEAGSALINARGNDVDIDPAHVSNVEEYVQRLNNQGISARGQIISATQFGRGDAIIDLAHHVNADLIILNTEEGGQRAKAALAEQVAKRNPRIAVLIARTTS